MRRTKVDAIDRTITKDSHTKDKKKKKMSIYTCTSESSLQLKQTSVTRLIHTDKFWTRENLDIYRTIYSLLETSISEVSTARMANQRFNRTFPSTRKKIYSSKGGRVG